MKILSRTSNDHKIVFSDKDIGVLRLFFEGCIDKWEASYEDAAALMPIYEHILRTDFTLKGEDVDDDDMVH